MMEHKRSAVALVLAGGVFTTTEAVLSFGLVGFSLSQLGFYGSLPVIGGTVLGLSIIVIGVGIWLSKTNDTLFKWSVAALILSGIASLVSGLALVSVIGSIVGILSKTRAQ